MGNYPNNMLEARFENTDLCPCRAGFATHDCRLGFIGTTAQGGDSSHCQIKRKREPVNQNNSGQSAELVPPRLHNDERRRQKDDGNNGLILGAGGDIVSGQDAQKPFQFMFTRQMQRQPFEGVAISPEPGTVSTLCRERKMFASNNFRKPPQRFVGIRLAIVIHEQPVVY
jgi:hypothetical protein